MEVEMCLGSFTCDFFCFKVEIRLSSTSEFNEVYFSEMGEAEATHSRDPRKINLGGETCKTSELFNRC